MAGVGLRSEKRAQAAPEPSSTPRPSTVHSSLAVQPCGGSSIPSTTQPGPKLGLHGKSPAMRYRSLAFQWAPCRSAVNGAPELSRKSGSQCAFRTPRPRRRPNSGIIPPTVSTSAWTSSLARNTALRPMYSTRLALAVFMGIPVALARPKDDSHLHDTSFESASCSWLGGACRQWRAGSVGSPALNHVRTDTSFFRSVDRVCALAQAFIPPSTVRFAPVMYEDSGPATNATNAATSFTCPKRSSAVAAFCGTAHSVVAGFNSVSIGPGCTLLTVMPRLATSLESAWVNIFTAPFVAE